MDTISGRRANEWEKLIKPVAVDLVLDSIQQDGITYQRAKLVGPDFILSIAPPLNGTEAGGYELLACMKGPDGRMDFTAELAYNTFPLASDQVAQLAQTCKELLEAGVPPADISARLSKAMERDDQ